MKSIQTAHYPVIFDHSLQSISEFVSSKNYSNVFILTDENTTVHCLPILQAAIGESFTYDLIEVDAGEENKNIDFCIGIWKTMLDFGADRKALMINLGGGVVTDMGGFAASTYKRGIDFIQVPTTLLSQVDASVGGKTGIDIDAVKNIIGTFAQPQMVVIHQDFLHTLDLRQQLSGFAEMIKHGLIKDEAYYQKLKTISFKEVSEELIYHSVSIKNEVVTADPTEQNERKILNFGHTIGHAVETYSLIHDREPLLHGEAIAIGMICEAYLSYKCHTLTEQELKDITFFFLHLYPKYDISDDSFEALMAYMQQDKKNENQQMMFSLLTKIGHCDINLQVTEAAIFDALRYYQGLVKV